MKPNYPAIYRSLVKKFNLPLALLSPRVRGLLKAATSGDYDSIRNDYWAEVYDAVEGYLSGSRPVTAFQNKMLVAMSESFTATTYLGYQEAGGELPFDDETSSWLGQKIATERQFIVDLFARLKDQRGELDPVQEALARAEGYASTLDQIYSEAKLLGMKNVMLTFVGEDGEESCPTCQKMKGKKHRASWWIKNDLVPGSSAYECGGFHCQHYLENPDGERVTL